MNDYINNESPLLKLKISTIEDDFPLFEDVYAFIFDFNLLYEVSRFGIDKKYSNVLIDNRIFFRKGRNIELKDKLRLAKI